MFSWKKKKSVAHLNSRFLMYIEYRPGVTISLGAKLPHSRINSRFLMYIEYRPGVTISLGAKLPHSRISCRALFFPLDVWCYHSLFWTSCFLAFLLIGL